MLFPKSMIIVNHRDCQEDKTPKFSIMGVIWATFKLDIILMFILCALNEGLIMGIYLNSILLVHWIHNGEGEADGVWRCLVFLLNGFLSTLVKSYFMLHSKLLAVNVNKCVSTVLYNKVLKMSQKSLVVTSTGKLVTLVSGELQTIEKTFWYVPMFIINVFLLFILFGYIGVFFLEASLIAFGIVLIMIFILLIFAGCNMKWMYMAGTYSDQRINHITDIIDGIKTIKAYCWEHIFDQKVKEVREMQLSYVKNNHKFVGFGSVVIYTTGYIVVLIVLSYHWGVGKKLDYSPSIVLLSLGTYISIGTIPVLLNGLSITLKIFSIFQRVTEVLVTEDRENDHAIEDDLNKENALSLSSLTATWGFHIKQDIYSGDTEVITDEPTLNLIDIAFDALKKDFIVIIGPVGCGKTSLFNAIMKELDIIRGDVKVNGTVSYVEQEPFITSDTVKGNILFGQEYDEDKLDEILDL